MPWMQSNGWWDVGGGNLQSHLGSTLCQAQKKRKNLELAATAQRSCLANWLTPYPAVTVAPIYALRMPQPFHPHSPVRHTPEKVNPVISLDGLSHLEKVCTLAKWLPMSVPEAKEGDIIYMLRAIDPKLYICSNDSPNEDWEAIDPPLNGIIRYGAMPKWDCWESATWEEWGWGTNKLPWVVCGSSWPGSWSVQRKARKIINGNVNTVCNLTDPVRTFNADNLLVFQSQAQLKKLLKMLWLSVMMMIQMIQLRSRLCTTAPPHLTTSVCMGMKLNFPHCLSPYNSYLIMMHDANKMEWDLEFHQGILYLHSWDCEHSTIVAPCCCPCLRIPKHTGYYPTHK